MGHPTPRDELVLGHDYTYAGKKHTAASVTDDFITALTQWVVSDSGKEYKGVLINFYMDGNDSIGAHSDDEAELVADSDIYSFSFGSTRRFWVMPKKIEEGDVKHEVIMVNNSLIVMRGTTQHNHKHQVPKMLKSECEKLAGADQRRINITYRLFR